MMSKLHAQNFLRLAASTQLAPHHGCRQQRGDSRMQPAGAILTVHDRRSYLQS